MRIKSMQISLDVNVLFSGSECNSESHEGVVVPADISSLITSLGSEEQAVRLAAAEQLLQMGPDAAPACVALVEATDSADAETKDLVTAALEDLGAPRVDAIPALVAILPRSTLDAPYWSATLLGRLQADATAAVGPLTTTAEKHPETAVRERAVWALGQIGDAASSAVEALKKISAGGESRLATLARDAVSKILK
jgi:HEAT repeat protein